MLVAGDCVGGFGEYVGVGHGFGLRLSQYGAVADWPQVFVEWMDTKGFLRGK